MLPDIVSTFHVAALSRSHTSCHWILVRRDQHFPLHFTSSGICGKQWGHLSVCCFLPSLGRTLYLSFLNFMRLQLPRSSSQLKSLWMASLRSNIAAACLTLWCHLWTWWQFSVTSSRSLVKMLNRTCPCTDPCSSLLDPSLQAEPVSLPTTGFYLSSCLPIQTVMYQLKYKKWRKKAH